MGVLPASRLTCALPFVWGVHGGAARDDSSYGDGEGAYAEAPPHVMAQTAP